MKTIDLQTGIAAIALFVAGTFCHAAAKESLGAPAGADTQRGEAHDTAGARRGKPHHRPAGPLVEAVREATRRYRHAPVAEAEGYELHFGCVSSPDEGAMGLHYVNMSRVGDGTLDVTAPEIVIYEPLRNGRLRLIGADYLVLAETWHASNEGTPQLGGQLMHLIESPNRYGLPAFYTLHVWAWKPNPHGTFTNWHPGVSCEAFDGLPH